MLRSRVGLTLVVILSFISVSSYAGDYYTSSPAHNSGYIRCFMVREHVRNGVVVPGHRVCVAPHAYAVCAKYVYSITPMHRDKYCSQWEWRSTRGMHWRHCGMHHHYHHHYYHHHHHNNS